MQTTADQATDAAASGGPRPHHRRRAGRPVPGGAPPVHRRAAGPPLRAARRVHADPHGVARGLPDRRLDRELQGGHDRRAGRRGDLRRDRARDAAGLPAHDRPGPAGAARGVDARVRAAEHDRADAQRADRGPRHRDGRAGRRAAHRRRRDRDARARRHPRRLHRHAVRDARPAAPGRRPRGPRSEHDAVPDGVRPRRHLPVRPALRVRRVLQVLQEPREHGLQVHPGGQPHVLRRVGQPRDRHHRHQPGRVRGDAAVIRRRLAARQLPGGRGLDGPVHRQGQGGDARRARRRPPDRPDPARRLPRAERDEPALARSPASTTRWRARRSSCSATRRSGRRTSSRSRSASSARSSSPATSATGRCRST